MTIDTNALKEHFSNMAIPTDKDFSNLIDLATAGQNAVVDNHDNTITANNLPYDLSKSGLTPVKYVSSGSFNDLPLGTVFADGTLMTDGPDTTHSFTTTTFYSTQFAGRKAQIAIADNENFMYLRVNSGINWQSWTLLSDDSKVVHDNHDGTITANGANILPTNENVINRIDGTYTDMNDIPMGWLYLNGWADVSGLANWGLPQDFYYIHCFKTPFSLPTTIQIAYGTQLNNMYVRTMSDTTWTTWKLLADDSKVAHLSGANNFDTVPTCGANNKPLAINDSGTTTSRPTTGIYAGYQYYDTDLKKPIWYNGSDWTDSIGAKV